MNLRDSAAIGLSISAVERDTGIGKDTLRVWERRYGFPTPNRDANGERTYPMVQVEKLRAIKRLMDQGHRPGRIVAQSLEALQHLSRGEETLQPARPLPLVQADDALSMVIPLLQNQDDEGLRTHLLKALSQEGLQQFVTHWVAPLTVRVGETWARGDLAVHQEHLFTECVSRILRQAISTVPKAATANSPTVLLTTFPQEAHGLGLLMVESLLTLQGCRCVSLGTQTPVPDIAQAAISYQADVVGLSFSANMNPNRIVEGLAELKLLLPEGMEVWVGGQAPVLQRRPMGAVRVMQDLASLAAAVQAWRQR